MTGLVKLDTIRKVEDVSERELVACNVLLFAQNLVVDIEPAAEGSEVLLNLRIIGFQTLPLLEDLLPSNSGCMGIPVGALDGSGLLDEGPLLEILGVELGALVGIFDGDVTTDGTTFIEDETIVLKDGDLAEGLKLHESFRFVFTLGHVDVDKLEGDFFLNENSRYTLSAGGDGEAVEFQDHGCDVRVVVDVLRRKSLLFNGFAGVLLSFSGAGLSGVAIERWNA